MEAPEVEQAPPESFRTTIEGRVDDCHTRLTAIENGASNETESSVRGLLRTYEDRIKHLETNQAEIGRQLVLMADSVAATQKAVDALKPPTQ